jgi:general secretion pathway protein A
MGTGDAMYETHFGLRHRPFRATADSECYYPATTHEQALGRLLQGLADDEGLVLLTAAPGLGKTLLCHRLLERLGPETVCGFVTNSHLRDRVGLLQALLFDLSQPYAGLGEQELRLTLTDYLLQNFQKGQKTRLIIDEAHHLSPDLLEELRLLGNLEGRQGKAVQVILAAQPGLLETLSLPALAGLGQRLSVRAELAALDVHEAADYLLHHLRACGGESVMADEALEILARGCLGVPRFLNQAAHQALALAASAGASQVDVEAALEVLTRLGLEAETGPEVEAPPFTFATNELADGEGGLEASEAAADEGPVVRAVRTDPPEEIGRSSRLYVPRRPA